MSFTKRSPEYEIAKNVFRNVFYEEMKSQLHFLSASFTRIVCTAIFKVMMYAAISKLYVVTFSFSKFYQNFLYSTAIFKVMMYAAISKLYAVTSKGYTGI